LDHPIDTARSSRDTAGPDVVRGRVPAQIDRSLAEESLMTRQDNCPHLLSLDPNVGRFTGTLAERVEAWDEIRRRCPVGKSAQHGGFWVFSDWESVSLASRDSDVFSHRYSDEIVDGIKYVGEIGIPRHPLPELALGEGYGPQHRYLRSTLNPYFAPRLVAKFEGTQRQAGNYFLDQVVESRSIDFIDDLISPATAIGTLLFMGLPISAWRDTAEVFHKMLGLPTGDPARTHIIEVVQPRMLDAFMEVVYERRAKPRNDIMSAVALLKEDGELYDDEFLRGLLWNIVGGGVDTTNNVTGRSLWLLSDDTGLRDKLIDEPLLLESAIEEFLRLFPSIQFLTRTATEDITVGGHEVRKGDPIVIAHVAANRDPAEFANPDVVDLERETNRHLTFGQGVHRCLGAPVARQMIRVLLEVVLERMPSFQVDSAAVSEYVGNPTGIGLWTLPANFTPSQSYGTARPW
jgi:cytochrome P450